NGFGVLIHNYGIEGVVYTTSKDPAAAAAAAALTYDQAAHALVTPSGEPAISLFQRVRVVLQVDDKPVSANVSSMRRKLSLRLVEPQIPGLSIAVGELAALRAAAAAAKPAAAAEESRIVELVTKHPDQVQNV
ncbi:exosome catalytic subunit dis3, partial [Coemansia helicoidea]